MKREAWKLVAGSACVYAIVAACSSDAAIREVREMADAAARMFDAGGTVPEPVDASLPTPRDEAGSSVAMPDPVAEPVTEPMAMPRPLDAMVDPVPEAGAQPSTEPEPEGSVSKLSYCEPGEGESSDYTFARASFEGLGELELARVIALVHWPIDTRPGAPTGYRSATAPVFVRDGEVAVQCGLSALVDENSITSVTFILPP